MTPLRAPSIVEQLLGGEEYRYSFFQAVRLVDLLFARATEQRVGRGLAPQDEPLRFQARASLAFPASELYALGYDPEDRQQFDRQRRVPLSPAWRNPQTPLPITTNFFGLFGPQGVLPLHYSEFVFQRLRLRPCRADRVLLDAGHRSDGLRRVDRGAEEHRIDEVSRRQLRLTNECTKLGGSTEASRANRWKSTVPHGWRAEGYSR